MGASESSCIVSVLRRRQDEMRRTMKSAVEPWPWHATQGSSLWWQQTRYTRHSMRMCAVLCGCVCVCAGKCMKRCFESNANAIRCGSGMKNSGTRCVCAMIGIVIFLCSVQFEGKTTNSLRDYTVVIIIYPHSLVRFGVCVRQGMGERGL